MANTLVDMFRMKDIKKKILITFGLLIVTRIGAYLPIPGINPSVIYDAYRASSSNITEYLNFFSGGAFSNFSIFMLGVMPYISTEIIFQLLMLVVPSLKKLAEDPQGQKKIQQYTATQQSLYVLSSHSLLQLMHSRSEAQLFPYR